ncbi:MAG: TonB family protein [Elusimicrobia bacterium]|nr:TonB family protein [Elusimicrobiota bacterium]
MTGALKPFLARSAGVHAALLVAAAFYVPSALQKADKVYMIDFVGGPAVLQSAGPAAAAKAEPDAAPARPTQQAEKDSFATKGHRAIALPRPSLLQGWSDRKAPPKPSMIPAPEAAITGAPGAAGGMPGNAAGVATDLPNFPYPWYISQVRQMLWAAWQKRMPAASGEGVVVFAIVRNGAFTDLRMESSSGDGDFDAAAVAAVQAAAPFPALPSDFAEPFLKIHLTLKSEASWR